MYRQEVYGTGPRPQYGASDQPIPAAQNAWQHHQNSAPQARRFVYTDEQRYAHYCQQREYEYLSNAQAAQAGIYHFLYLKDQVRQEKARIMQEKEEEAKAEAMLEATKMRLNERANERARERHAALVWEIELGNFITRIQGDVACFEDAKAEAEAEAKAAQEQETRGNRSRSDSVSTVIRHMSPRPLFETEHSHPHSAPSHPESSTDLPTPNQINSSKLEHEKTAAYTAIADWERVKFGIDLRAMSSTGAVAGSSNPSQSSNSSSLAYSRSMTASTAATSSLSSGTDSTDTNSISSTAATYATSISSTAATAGSWSSPTASPIPMTPWGPQYMSEYNNPWLAFRYQRDVEDEEDEEDEEYEEDQVVFNGREE